MGSIPIFWLKPYAFHDVVGSFGFNYGDASFSFDFFLVSLILLLFWVPPLNELDKPSLKNRLPPANKDSCNEILASYSGGRL